MSNTLFCFGFGYSAQFLARRLVTMGWNICGTSRDIKNKKSIPIGVTLFDFSEKKLLNEEALKELETAEAVLISIPPGDEVDLVFEHYSDIICKNKNLKWVGYLSTTGVYGNCNGNWVDETTPPKPKEEREEKRFNAEKKWLSLFEQYQTPIHIFRLAGIYGPLRNPMVRIQNGNGQIITKRGHFFNRIHVEDITQILKKSLDYPSPGEIFNLSDDEPAPQADVMYFAYRLLGDIAPAPVDFEEADLSEMARSFYSSNKRVKNDKVKKQLDIDLKYPNYRKGLTTLRYPNGFV